MTNPMPPSIDRESPAFKAACAAFSKSEWASEEPRLQAAIEAYLSAAKAPLTEAQMEDAALTMAKGMAASHFNKNDPRPHAKARITKATQALRSLLSAGWKLTPPGDGV